MTALEETVVMDHYRQATAADVASIVALHMRAFTDSFLTSMGSAFLRSYYHALCAYPSARVVIAERHGQIVGYVGVLLPNADFYHYLYRHYLIPIARAALRAALTRRAARRGLLQRSAHLVRALSASVGWAPARNPDAEANQARLLVLVVAPDQQGKNVAGPLVEQAIARLRTNDVQSMRLCVDQENWRAMAFYRKTGWREQGLWGRRSRLYVRWFGEATRDQSESGSTLG